MAEFRLYFCDADDRIVARAEFCAPDDNAGLSIAATIGEASADTHSGYLLWQGTRFLYSSRTAAALQVRRFTRAGATAAAMTAERQDLIIELEESLLRSHWHIAKSLRLLEATARLRDKRAAEQRTHETPLAS
jgi:hypothetical protein